MIVVLVDKRAVLEDIHQRAMALRDVVLALLDDMEERSG